MVDGIRATIELTASGDCPLVRFSSETGAVIDRVWTSVAPPGPTGSATEFLVDAPDGDGEWEPVFAYGETNLYRVRHGEEANCPCVCLAEFECPIHHFFVDGEDLTLAFHAADFGQLQDIIGELRQRYETIDVTQLLQPPVEDAPLSSVFVNRGRLTGRQFEVLQTAYEMGYFERPKRANATEIAAELGISQSTVTEHLIAAQRKILDDVLVDRTDRST